MKYIWSCLIIVSLLSNIAFAKQGGIGVGHGVGGGGHPPGLSSMPPGLSKHHKTPYGWSRGKKKGWYKTKKIKRVRPPVEIFEDDF